MQRCFPYFLFSTFFLHQSVIFNYPAFSFKILKKGTKRDLRFLEGQTGSILTVESLMLNLNKFKNSFHHGGIGYLIALFLVKLAYVSLRKVSYMHTYILVSFSKGKSLMRECGSFPIMLVPS